MIVKLRHPLVLSASILTLILVFFEANHAQGLTATVQQVNGSPTLLIDGKPTAPLIFFGWTKTDQPYRFALGKTWKTYGFSFVAPEDNQSNFAVHIRLGGSGAGTVWIDNARLYEGPRDDDTSANMLDHGNWEGTKQETARAWHLFTNKGDYGSDADWDVVDQDGIDGNAAKGKKACRLTIRAGGSETMHCHFYQSGMSCKKGRRYTFTVAMKADKLIKGDLLTLRHGGTWMQYPPQTTDSPFHNQARRAAAAGVHIHSFGIPMPWPKPGQSADYSGVRRAFETVLQADPKALFLPRFGMSAPAWWQKAHPEECLTFDDGKKRGECPASLLWRRECLRHLRGLVRFCEEHYGDHMLGYHPCGQHTGEWFYQRSWEPRLSGFSPAMNDGFRRCLKERYKTDTGLRKAWGNQQVTLDNAAVPSPEQRRTATHGLFRDPLAERQLLDFYEYKQLAMEEPLEEMARVIKEETDGKKLVTLFYGYFFDMCGLPSGPQISGHLAMQRMLKCPHVDILCSPISYFDRASGGSGPFMTAVDSVSTAGKLWLNEDDTRTYLTPKEAGFGRVATPKKTLWVHDRNYGNIQTRRMACWYMDLGGIGWLDGQDIWDNIRLLRQHYETSLAEPTTFSPEVAVIVDERSALALACKHTVMSPQVYLLRKRLYRLGAPIRIHYLNDLLADKIPPCKAYIFLNPFWLDNQTRTTIAKATAGKTAVYFYGSGFLGERADDALMSQLITMRVSRVDSPTAQATYLKGDSPLLAGLPATPFGSKSKLTPLWTIDKGQDITPLATLPDGRPIVAARKSTDGLRVYIGTTDAPEAFLRNILEVSGVHLYIKSNDVLNADERFLAITATTAGKKIIRLPKPKTVRNLHDKTIIATNTKSLEIPMSQGETRLLLLDEITR